MTGDKRLMASLIYGAGLRLRGCLCLRVQDIDFKRTEIIVRDGKGAKDRVTMLPESLKKSLKDHLRKVKAIPERDLAEAVRKAGLTKRATCHTLLHSFATHLPADVYDIRTVQDLLRHKDLKTTMIYTHVLNRGGRGVKSPVDDL